MRRGLLFAAVHRLLTAVASLAVEHSSGVHGFHWLWRVGSVVTISRLWTTGSVVVVHELCCSTACEIFLTQG